MRPGVMGKLGVWISHACATDEPSAELLRSRMIFVIGVSWRGSGTRKRGVTGKFSSSALKGVSSRAETLKLKSLGAGGGGSFEVMTSGGSGTTSCCCCSFSRRTYSALDFFANSFG
uniref:(northern house mosquito) hypothetical protein n=1 Tax=Culex pipiens TaxID=7175 RepID=A0A8D8J0Q9_CULPI